jgi:hypothetical protein
MVVAEFDKRLELDDGGRGRSLDSESLFFSHDFLGELCAEGSRE